MQKIIIAITLLAAISTAYAKPGQRYGGTFFNSQGTEVQIIYNTSQGAISALGFATNCYNHCDTVRSTDMAVLLVDFVTAVKYNRLYTYNAPPSDCNDISCTDPHAAGGRGGKYDALITALINGAGQQVGSNSINAVAKQIAENSDNNTTPVYQVIFKAIATQHIPITMCKIHSNKSCVIDDDVTFTVFSDGKIGVSAQISDTFELYTRDQALNEYLENFDYNCTIALTGTIPNLISQRVCYYAP